MEQADRQADRQTDKKTDGQDHVLSQADALTKKVKPAGADLGQTQLKVELGLSFTKICCIKLIKKLLLPTLTATNKNPLICISN